VPLVPFQETLIPQKGSADLDTLAFSCIQARASCYRFARRLSAPRNETGRDVRGSA
jgi:hypothetical protein